MSVGIAILPQGTATVSRLTEEIGAFRKTAFCLVPIFGSGTAYGHSRLKLTSSSNVLLAAFHCQHNVLIRIF